MVACEGGGRFRRLRQQAILGRAQWDAHHAAAIYAGADVGALRDIVRDTSLETLSDAVLVIEGKATYGVDRQLTDQWLSYRPSARSVRHS